MNGNQKVLLRQLKHWFKSLGARLDNTILHRLVKESRVKVFSDIYKLKASDFENLHKVTDAKRGEFMTEVRDSADVSLCQLIGGMDIPHCDLHGVEALKGWFRDPDLFLKAMTADFPRRSFLEVTTDYGELHDIEAWHRDEGLALALQFITMVRNGQIRWLTTPVDMSDVGNNYLRSIRHGA